MKAFVGRPWQTGLTLVIATMLPVGCGWHHADEDLGQSEAVRVSVDSSTGVDRVDCACGPPSLGEVVTNCGSPSISGDGRFVSFTSWVTSRDVSVLDRTTGQTEGISASGLTKPSGPGLPGGSRGGYPSLTRISADGRFVVFLYHLPGGRRSGDGSCVLLLHDRTAGSTEQLAVCSTQRRQIRVKGSGWPSISEDGRFVAFVSDDPTLVSNDTNGTYDVFVLDRETGATERVSVSSSGGEADNFSYEPAISGDRRFVAFTSAAMNLTSTTGKGEGVFVHDRETHRTEEVSVSFDDGRANGWSLHPSISADGRFVAFCSNSTNLVPNDTHPYSDIYVRDIQARLTEKVSVTSAGDDAGGNCGDPSISADGRFVAFVSSAGDLAPGRVRGQSIFIHDRQKGLTEIASLDSSGKPAGAGADHPVISADGRFVAFTAEIRREIPAVYAAEIAKQGIPVRPNQRYPCWTVFVARNPLAP